jgi:dCMP deaminase
MGYNGFPRNVDDLSERLKDRDLKLKLILHAEQNALLFAHEPLIGCRIYVWPFMPCSRCAGMIIQSGITEVIAPVSDNPRWIDDFEIARDILFNEAKIKLRLPDDIELD